MKKRKKLKIGQLNLEAGRGTTKGYHQYATEFWKNFLPHPQSQIEAAGEFIGKEGIDIMCLTEVDDGSFRSCNENQIELISKISGLPFHAYFEAYSIFGRVLGLGNAIVSRYPILRSKKFLIKGGMNPRVIGKSIINVKGQEVDVYSTHLSLGERSRHPQLDYLSKVIENGNYVILGADLNEQENEKLERLMKKANMEIARTRQTYPSWDSTRTLDYLMTRGFEIKCSRTHNEARFSDHLPITADIYFN